MSNILVSNFSKVKIEKKRKKKEKKNFFCVLCLPDFDCITVKCLEYWPFTKDFKKKRRIKRKAA